MTNPVYGANTAALQAYLPQWSAEGSGDPHTAARIVKLIEHKAGIVNGLIKAKGYDPDEINADTDGSAYALLQALLCGLVLPSIFQGLMMTPDQEEQAAWAKEWLEDFKKDPEILGFPDSSIYPRAYTTVQSKGLAVTDAAKRARHRWTKWSASTTTGSKDRHW